MDQVNIKATTEEHLGFTGREEGISSQAVCLLESFYESSVAVADSANRCSSCQDVAKNFKKRIDKEVVSHV